MLIILPGVFYTFEMSEDHVHMQSVNINDSSALVGYKNEINWKENGLSYQGRNQLSLNHCSLKLFGNCF